MTAQAQIAKLKAAGQHVVLDTTRRFGYSGGVPYLTMDPKYSGLPSRMVPGGSLITFLTEIESVVGPYNDQKKVYTHIPRQITPKEQVFYVAKKFHEGTDAGFRELKSLTSQEYGFIPANPQTGQPETFFDNGTQYFNLVHPAITCEYGLETKVESHAEGNVGASWYQACPTCRLANLQSAETEARIQASHLDKEVLIALRQELINACRAAIAFAEDKVNKLEADLERRMRGEHGRTYRYEVDYIYLKMLHREAPQAVKPMSPQEIVTQAASAAAAGVVSALQTPAPAPAVVEAAPVAAVPEDAVVLTGDDKAEYEKWQAKRAQLAQARAAKEEKNGTGSDDPAGNEGNS